MNFTMAPDEIHILRPWGDLAMGLYKDSVLGHENADELARLKMLETMADPQTFAILEGIGVTPTWNCLEIGARGTVAVRLAGSRPCSRHRSRSTISTIRYRPAQSATQ